MRLQKYIGSLWSCFATTSVYVDRCQRILVSETAGCRVEILEWFCGHPPPLLSRARVFCMQSAILARPDQGAPTAQWTKAQIKDLASQGACAYVVACWSAGDGTVADMSARGPHCCSRHTKRSIHVHKGSCCFYRAFRVPLQDVEQSQSRHTRLVARAADRGSSGIQTSANATDNSGGGKNELFQSSVANEKVGCLLSEQWSSRALLALRVHVGIVQGSSPTQDPVHNQELLERPVMKRPEKVPLGRATPGWQNGKRREVPSVRPPAKSAPRAAEALELHSPAPEVDAGHGATGKQQGNAEDHTPRRLRRNGQNQKGKLKPNEIYKGIIIVCNAILWDRESKRVLLGKRMPGKKYSGSLRL